MKGGCLQNQLWHNTETSEDQNLQTCGSHTISCKNGLCPAVTFTLSICIIYVGIHIPAVCHGLLENILKTIFHTHRHHWKSISLRHSHISSCLFFLSKYVLAQSGPLESLHRIWRSTARNACFRFLHQLLKGFQSTNSMKFPYPPSPGRWNVHHYLSNFLDDLDHVLQEPSAAKIWKQQPFSQESKELSSSIKGWSFPHLWGLCFTWHWEFCNSVWATISYPFCNLSMLGWPMGQHAYSNTSAQKQACITDIPHTRATLNLSTPRHVQACGMRCCVKNDSEGDAWSVASAVPAETCEFEGRSPVKNTWIFQWTHDLSSFQISFGPNHQVLDFILLSREDHWSLAQGNFQLLESWCDVGITTGTMPKLTV